jgi:hypothetical protein
MTSQFIMLTRGNQESRAMGLLGWDNEQALQAHLESEEIETMRLRCLSVGCTADRWTLALQIIVSETQCSVERSHEFIMRKLNALYDAFARGDLL